MRERRLLLKRYENAAYSCAYPDTQSPTMPLARVELLKDVSQRSKTLRGSYRDGDPDIEINRSLWRPVTRTMQNLLFARWFSAQESLHEQGKMLPRNPAAFCRLLNHTFMLGQFCLEIGFCELLDCTLLGFHVRK